MDVVSRVPQLLDSIQLDFWRFHSLVIILMWLGEEVSCVYLLLRCDQKSLSSTFEKSCDYVGPTQIERFSLSVD